MSLEKYNFYNDFFVLLYLKVLNKIEKINKFVLIYFKSIHKSL